VSNRDGTRFWGRTQRIRFPVFLETFNTIDWVEPSDTLLANDRYLRKAEVQRLQKCGAQHVRIKGQAVGLSPTDASASWDRIWLVVSTPFQFSSRSGRGAGRNLAVASSALRWRRRMGRGSVAAITLHEKAVQPLHRRIAIESSRGSRRRVERLSAAGIPTGSDRGRPDAASPSFGSSSPSTGYEWIF
jgi:hypothetical protein